MHEHCLTVNPLKVVGKLANKIYFLSKILNVRVCMSAWVLFDRKFVKNIRETIIRFIF